MGLKNLLSNQKQAQDLTKIRPTKKRLDEGAFFMG
jgi:hypothetical protein